MLNPGPPNPRPPGSRPFGTFLRVSRYRGDISNRYISPIGDGARLKQPGMLELPVLGLLKEKSMHGYELRKQLGAMLGPFWQVSWGSLYPTLRRLTKAGAIEKLAETAPPRTRRTRSQTAKAPKPGSLG